MFMLLKNNEERICRSSRMLNPFQIYPSASKSIIRHLGGVSFTKDTLFGCTGLVVSFQNIISTCERKEERLRQAT